jgi:hypothetical protein
MSVPTREPAESVVWVRLAGAELGRGICQWYGYFGLSKVCALRRAHARVRVCGGEKSVQWCAQAVDEK